MNKSGTDQAVDPRGVLTARTPKLPGETSALVDDTSRSASCVP